MTHPIASLYSLLSEDCLNANQHLDKLLSRIPSLRVHSPIPAGKYWFVGKTVNDGDGNTTYTKGLIVVEDDLSLHAEVDFEEGTNYNPATSGKWGGRTISGGSVKFTETLPTHDGAFIYDGQVSSEHGEVSGTYYWDIKPLATGKFNFHLFKSEVDDFECEGVKPMELCGVFGYEQEISRSAFCWRWIHRDNYGDDFRVVTIEEHGNIPSCTTPPHLRPRDFQGTNGFYDNLEHSFFCWRWHGNYKVLTIEDPPYLSPHEGSRSIKPGDLSGVNGYKSEANGLQFCWRWMTFNNGTYRVVTLE